MKSCFHRRFPHQIRPQITVQLYMLRDDMISKRHTLSIEYTMLV